MTNWVGHGWSIDVDQSGARIVGPRHSFTVEIADAESVTLRRGLLVWKLRRPDCRPKWARGMRRVVAKQAKSALALLLFVDELHGWVRRFDEVHSACEEGLWQGRWVPWDVRDAFLMGRDPDFPERLQRSAAAPMLSERDVEVLAFSPEAMAFIIDQANERILANELDDRRDFFATIEAQPLTNEQAQVVITFDNRVQVLAAAGSGKTSVMVARAAYAVARGFVRPERILLLAFNKKAAEELDERIKDRFDAAGLLSAGVQVRTFHSFGLSMIGAATGRKPTLAPWVDNNQQMQKISDLVDGLRASDKEFRYQWDLYRLVFAPVPMDPGRGVPDGYDRERKESGYETLGGDIVASEGERMIANWLYINGVNYRYHEPYLTDAADPRFGQYQPGFYYPDIGAWHEHWALDSEGNPPEDLEGYAAEMHRKRSLQAREGTDLIETTFAEVVLRDEGFAGLEKALVSRGITLGWDPQRSRRGSGYDTLGGDLVRSEGERLIADWLFRNGVKYRYEEPYVFDVADASHCQYRPDFYYPDIDAWHEHWALDREGKPPAEFTDYAEGMRWKQKLHAKYGTDLIETTYGEIVQGNRGFSGLAKALVSRGIKLDWDPQRPLPPRKERHSPKDLVSHEQMVKLILAFLSHVKSSGATKESLQHLLATTRRSLAGARTQGFLDVFWPVFDAWNEALRAAPYGGYVDFDDMLGSAADLIADGHDPGYDLVLVDEFQDSSQVRARFVDGLIAPGNRYLMTVGDDWQAVNRFAGADLAVMTDFHERFGPGPQLALTTTFRCSQVICDVASQFVAKNQRQFDKAMRSVEQKNQGAPVEIIFADEPGGAVKACLERVASKAGSAGASVFILGRYRFEKEDALPRQTPPGLKVEFRTVHSSKGTESDYVIIPGMKAGKYGFPSTIADDPVLDLVMGDPDTFDHAEERRLLYVALTRARRGVYLIASHDHPSPFVTELLETANPPDGDELVVQVDKFGRPIPAAKKVRPCPCCKEGRIVTRQGPKGPFSGCSKFPACTFKEFGQRAEGEAIVLCPQCHVGELRKRDGKFGAFFGCSTFPACKFTRDGNLVKGPAGSVE